MLTERAPCPHYGPLIRGIFGPLFSTNVFYSVEQTGDNPLIAVEELRKELLSAAKMAEQEVEEKKGMPGVSA